MSVNGVNGVNCENNNLYMGEYIYQKHSIYVFSRIGIKNDRLHGLQSLQDYKNPLKIKASRVNDFVTA